MANIGRELTVPLEQINYLAILAASIVCFSLGFVWFSIPYIRQQSDNLAIISSIRNQGFTLSFIGTFISAFAVSYLLAWLQIKDFHQALILGLILGIGVVVPVYSDSLICGGKQKAVMYMLGYRIMFYVVLTVVLAVW